MTRKTILPRGRSASWNGAIPAGGGGRRASARVPPTLRLLTQVAAFLLFLGAGSAQMDEPLLGQGNQPKVHTDVYINVLLDRLLNVDDKNFRFSAVIYLYLNWKDPRAYGEIKNRTTEVRSGGAPCERVCDGPGNARSTWQACCDTIWIPDFNMDNVEELPEGRIAREEIGLVGEDLDIVTWFVSLQGAFYTGMNFRDFPFDDQILDIRFRLDTQGSDKQLVTLVPSASAFSKRSGSGQKKHDNDLDGWEIQAVNVSVNKEDTSYTPITRVVTSYPHPNEPAPYIGKASVFRFDPDTADPFIESLDVSHQQVQIVSIDIKISRVWNKHVLNLILPVMLCLWLCSVVFFMDHEDLETRFGTVVTLFLALVAVQFVAGDVQPSSMDIIATQQLVIVTYFYMGIIALECILVYRLGTQHKRVERLAEFCRAEKHALEVLEKKGILLRKTLPILIDKQGMEKTVERHTRHSQDSRYSSSVGNESSRKITDDRISEERSAEEEAQESIPEVLPPLAEGGRRATDKEGKGEGNWSDLHWWCCGAFKRCAPSRRPHTFFGKVGAAIYYCPHNVRHVKDYGSFLAWRVDHITFIVVIVSYHVVICALFFLNDLSV